MRCQAFTESPTALSSADRIHAIFLHARGAVGMWDVQHSRFQADPGQAAAWASSIELIALMNLAQNRMALSLAT